MICIGSPSAAVLACACLSSITSPAPVRAPRALLSWQEPPPGMLPVPARSAQMQPHCQIRQISSDTTTLPDELRCCNCFIPTQSYPTSQWQNLVSKKRSNSVESSCIGMRKNIYFEKGGEVVIFLMAPGNGLNVVFPLRKRVSSLVSLFYFLRQFVVELKLISK